MRVIGLSLAALLCLVGCSSSEVLVAHSVGLATTTEVVPEDQLLDVSVVVFNPGVPDGEIPQELLDELIRDGKFVHIRRMESVYMSVVMRDTLQDSGHWGAVWVTPETTQAADLNVTAEIVQSDGDLFELDVTALDATGRTWLEKTYDMTTAAGSYNRQRFPDADPYQDVFNSISNDLAAARASLTASDAEQIRSVAAMRYAAELSPDAFAAYVEENRGQYELVRLPAAGDPMFDRTQRIRQRERIFIETLEQHYDALYREADESYYGWREFTREEAQQIRELKKSARLRTTLGVATIIASIAYGTNGGNDSFGERMVRDAMMYIGADMLQTSALRRQERALHAESLRELSESLEDEVEPLVVSVLSTEHRLTGTAELQYQEWRRLLREIYIDETGFVPEDLSIYADPDEPEAGVEVVPGDAEATDAATGSSTVEAAPAEAAPANAASNEAAAAEGTPADAAPEDAAPAQSAPAQLVPADTSVDAVGVQAAADANATNTGGA